MTDSFVLTQDIDASGTSSWNGGSGFDPIGDSGTQFTGTFDGNDHDVSNLYINRGTEQYVGLFGFVGSVGQITDLAVTDANITGEGQGGPTGPGVGAIVGTNRGDITRSSASGEVTSTLDLAGGLVGNNDDGKISESYADVTVDGPNGGMAGLVGTNTGAGVIEDSYSTGNVTGSFATGGFVGDNTGIIRTSYAVGNVSTDGGGGGGVPESIETSDKESYGTDSVVTPQATGSGLVGGNFGTVTDSYWDINTTNRTSSAGGTGLKTSEMKGQAAKRNMSFDFTTTWDVRTGSRISYPYLRNNTQSPAPGLEGNCLDRRSIGRGQQDRECSRDRGISRGESRSIGRNRDSARRNRGRRSRGR